MKNVAHYLILGAIALGGVALANSGMLSGLPVVGTAFPKR